MHSSHKHQVRVEVGSRAYPSSESRSSIHARASEYISGELSKYSLVLVHTHRLNRGLEFMRKLQNIFWARFPPCVKLECMTLNSHCCLIHLGFFKGSHHLVPHHQNLDISADLSHVGSSKSEYSIMCALTCYTYVC
jgi:hypothetical protein